MLRVRIILWIIFLLIWFVWDFLPVIPWPLLTYFSMIFLQIADKNCFATTQLVIFWIIMVLITFVDYITPVIGTKKMWWTKRWTRWSMIWLILWVIVLPLFGIVLWPFGLIWLLWWPFIWAYIWEILYQKNHDVILSKALRSASAEKNLKKTKNSSQWQIINRKKALKAAFWSFMWFLGWILIKVIYTIVVAIYVFPRIRFAVWHKDNIAENYWELKEIDYTIPEFKLINKWQYYDIKFEWTKVSYNTWENWNNRFIINDTNNDQWSCHRNNKPVSLVADNWKLYINILDTCGWWSGDWYVSKLELNNAWNLKLVWCFRYDNRWQFENDYYDNNWNRYFEWTTQYEKLNKAELLDCEWNFEVIYENNI